MAKVTNNGTGAAAFTNYNLFTTACMSCGFAPDIVLRYFVSNLREYGNKRFVRVANIPNNIKFCFRKFKPGMKIP